MLGRGVAGDLRRDAEADAAAAHLRERHRAFAAIRPVGVPVLARTDFIDGPREVAVPLDGVHSQVKVRVEYQHSALSISQQSHHEHARQAEH